MRADALPILIVEDDDTYVSFLREILGDAGGQQFEVAAVRHLGRILPSLEARPATVVLLDVHLPDGNGLAWLRDHRDRLDAAVVVLTGQGEYDSAEEIAPGADDFLLKHHVDRYQLVRAIRYAAERHRSRRELLASRAYFQSLIDRAHDLITVVDRGGTVVYQSPSSATVIGLDPAAVVGRPVIDLVAPCHQDRARAVLAGGLERNADEGALGEFDVRHANGTVRTLDVVASRLPAVDGRSHVVLNSRDVTDRRAALEALRTRDQQLRQAQKMEAVGRLAGGIAHDFSNVLTVIIAASERLHDQFQDAPAAADLRSILRNCERASSLTRQLLAFSRQQTLAPQPLDVGELVHRAGRLLKRLIGEHVVLAIDVPPEPCTVEADPTQLEQVLMNLSINARDAMPNGGSLRILLRQTTVDAEFAGAHPPMAAGPYVLLQVTDTGVGMTPDTAAHAFEPFFTTKHPGKGTGLGLATVYGIVKQSGGYIYIDSEPGRGTTFRIFLPPTTAAPVVPDVSVRVARTVAPATILLAEDEDEVRGLLRDLLEAQGHTVLEANGPVRGLEVAAAYEGPIDLLLTDVVMPGGTGRDLARQLAITRPATKVLYMSGYPDFGGSPRSVLEQGVPFLAKPFTKDALLTKLHELLGDSSVPRS